MVQKTDIRLVKNKIKDYADLLKKKGIKVEKMILFGSYSKGKATSWSDIDLCVVSSEFGRKPWLEAKKLNRLALEVDENLQPFPFNPSDLNDKYSTLIAEIKKGQVLKFV